MVQSPESGRLTCSTNITIKLSVRMCLSAILIYTNKSAKFIYFAGTCPLYIKRATFRKVYKYTSFIKLVGHKPFWLLSADGRASLRGASNLIIFSKKYHSTQEKHTRAHVLRGLSPIPHPFWSQRQVLKKLCTDGILKSCAYPEGSSL